MTIPPSDGLSLHFTPYQWDLTPRLFPYLDRQMILVLLDHMIESNVYDRNAVLNAKHTILAQTKQVDEWNKLYKQLYSDDNSSIYDQRRKHVLERLDQLRRACGMLYSEVFQNRDSDHEEVEIIAKDGNFNFQYLAENYDVTQQNIDALYAYALHRCEIGFWESAAEYLTYYRLLAQDEESLFWSLWGKTCCEIMSSKFDTALNDIYQLNELINQRAAFSDQLEILQQRTWLIHWSLFAFFNLANGRQALVDFFMQDKLLNAIQIACPHILRYLTFALLVTQHQKSIGRQSSQQPAIKPLIKEMIRILLQTNHKVEQVTTDIKQIHSVGEFVMSGSERKAYIDPIISFLLSLYVDYNLKAVSYWLNQCKIMMKTDWFLGHFSNEFLKCAHHLVFDVLQRTRTEISISELKSILCLSDISDPDEIVVELIKESARCNDCKIDSQRDVIVVSQQLKSGHQLLIEKTRTITYRSLTLLNNCEKRMGTKSIDAQD